MASHVITAEREACFAGVRFFPRSVPCLVFYSSMECVLGRVKNFAAAFEIIKTFRVSATGNEKNSFAANSIVRINF
jgi:hypothetical protein